MNINKLFISLLIMSFLFINITEGAGLRLNINNYTVNKVYNTDYSLPIQIFNDEPYTFYNITFETNDWISMPFIPQLLSGYAINVTATIRTNEISNKLIRIKGVYFSAIGSSNLIYNVNVNAYYSTPCSFTIVKGDTINWTNRLLSTITLRNYPGSLPIDGATMASNISFNKIYNTPGNYGVQAFIGGWGFGEVCYISVLDTNGYVNNPSLDALLNINLNTFYSPTNISLTLTKTNYNLSFIEQDDGVLSITNTGVNIAKNILLSGEWFSFSNNNFDLNPGQTKAVSYTISPYITQTTQTNKTHVKTLSVGGNFNTINQNFDIFINYADIGNETSITNSTDILSFICRICPECCKPNVVYKYVLNNSNQTSYVPITDEQWREYNLNLMNEKEKREALEAYIKANFYEINNNLNSTSKNILILNNDLQKKEEANNVRYQNLTAYLLIGAVLIFVVGGGAITFFYIRRNKLRDLNRY